MNTWITSVSTWVQSVNFVYFSCCWVSEWWLITATSIDWTAPRGTLDTVQTFHNHTVFILYSWNIHYMAVWVLILYICMCTSPMMSDIMCYLYFVSISHSEHVMLALVNTFQWQAKLMRCTLCTECVIRMPFLICWRVSVLILQCVDQCDTINFITCYRQRPCYIITFRNSIVAFGS